MTFWQATRDKARYLYSILEDYPGQTQADLARIVDWHRSAVYRCLPAMEYFGYLLWEDDNGKLYPHRISGARDVARL